MLLELPKQTQKEVHQIGVILNWWWSFRNNEEWDACFNKLRNHVCDTVLSILLKEDSDKSKKFLTST